MKQSLPYYYPLKTETQSEVSENTEVRGSRGETTAQICQTPHFIQHEMGSEEEFLRVNCGN